MLSCKEATKLISQGLDKNLSLSQRIGLRFHLFMCNRCRNYQHHLRFIHKTINQIGSHIETPHQHKLSDEAKQRMREKLK